MLNEDDVRLCRNDATPTEAVEYCTSTYERERWDLFDNRGRMAKLSSYR
jgi:hypothetical protein